MLYNNYAIFGQSGSGKTFFINNNLIPCFKKESVFAVDFKQGLNVLQQNRRHSVETLLMEAKTRKNSMFIIDDGTGILKAGNSNVISDILFLLNTARHDNNYYVFVYHGTGFYPQAFTAGIHGFVFFEISDTSKQIESNIPVFTHDEVKAIKMKKQKYKSVTIYKNK